MNAAPPTVSDAWIAERWPDEDPAEVRRRFDALMDKLGESPWRGIPRFPGLMADVLAATARLPEQRIKDVEAALAGVPGHLRGYEWFAGRAAFGEQYVYGDDGHGMGRQGIACAPGGKAFNLAPFIAAASPKNVGVLLADLARLRASALALYMAGRWRLPDDPDLNGAEQAKLWEDLRDALGLEPGTATAAGVADTPPPPHNCPKCDDAMECDCEPPLPMFDAYAHADGSRECRPASPALRAALERPGVEL